MGRAGDSRSDDLSLPERIGPYRVRGVLGEGGMGRVYLADQEHPHRSVALKVVPPGLLSEDARRRFEREAEALARVRHSGIAAIYEAGTAKTDLGEQPYLAMEYVRGEDLTTYAEQRELDGAQRVTLMARLCDAVHAAHEVGVIHRDLKPANVLVDEAGNPKVLDFGLARLVDGDGSADAHTTTTGRILGTPQYMSPEQVTGAPHEIDRRADVYAIGVMLYELLAGKKPYTLDGKTIPEVLRTICEEEPAPLRSSYRLGADIETIAHKALEKDRERRYSTAADLAADLRRFLADEPIRARPASTWYQLKKFASRNRMLVGGVATVVVVLAVALVAVWGALGRAIDAERAERASRAQSLAQSTELDARNGFWSRAIESSEAALRIGHPDEVGLRTRKAEAWISLERADEATKELGLVEARGPLSPKAKLLRSELLIAHSPAEPAARSLAEESLAGGLAAAEASYAQGLLAGTADDAVARFRHAVELDPFHLRANRRLGLLLAALGRREEAAERMRAAQVLYPSDPGVALLLGFARVMDHDDAGARAALATAKEAIGEKRLGTVFDAFVATRTFLEDLEKTAVFPGGVPDEATEDPIRLILRRWLAAVRALGDAFSSETKPGIALGLALPVSPVLAETFHQLDRSFTALDGTDDSATNAAFRETYRRHPIAIFAHLEGYNHFGGGRWSEALERLRVAEGAPSLTRTLPDQIRVGGVVSAWWLGKDEKDMERQGALQREAGAFAKRISDRESLALSPLWITAALTDWAGDVGLAREFLDVAQKRAPDDLDVLRIRARVELHAKSYSAAIEAADRYLALGGKDGRVTTHREDALKKLKEFLETPR
jgi:tetratricopeptide (TPR) repeat protein/predicted Ser/Thr protein kinase